MTDAKTTDTTTDNDQGKFKIGIVGHGFVGKAVEFGFQNPITAFKLIDPKYNTNIDQLVDWNPNVVFVCAPTPQRRNGKVDATIVTDAVLKLARLTSCGIVIKSTITPDVLDSILTTLANEAPKPEEEGQLPAVVHRIVYNPEFLQENSSKQDFVNPDTIILGGTPEATAAIMHVYKQFSNVDNVNAKVITMSHAEAAFVKYGINAFLATKVTFFNQLYDATKKFGTGFNVIRKAIAADARIGPSHTHVPGYDLKRGFGGACFPKDLTALTLFDDQFTLVEKVLEINSKYREVYDLDEREKANNVDYGQTEKEQ